METKVCKNCNIDLPITDYYKGVKNASICKKCKREKNKVYMEKYLSNPVNRERMRDNGKNYEKTNKDKARKYEKWKNKRNNDELFAIRVRLRNLIRGSFRKSGCTNFTMKTESIVGISYNEFKIYMESNFVNGMSWENRGEWHIDHIIPLSSAKSEGELIALSHYTNLQPLWVMDNLKKGARVDMV